MGWENVDCVKYSDAGSWDTNKWVGREWRKKHTN